MSRYIRLTLLGLMLVSIFGSGSAAAGARALAPYHEPPLLLQRGRAVALAYALLPGSARGSVFVRNSQQRTYTRLPLTPATYCPGDPADAAAMRRDKKVRGGRFRFVLLSAVGAPLLHTFETGEGLVEEAVARALTR